MAMDGPKAGSKTTRAAVERAGAPKADPELETLRKQVTQLQRLCSLGILAGSVCHELNNALTPILNYAKLGLRSKDPDFRRKALEQILEGAQRAAAISTGMLGLARPRMDQRAPADLVTLTEQILMLTAKDLQKHRVEVELVVAEGRPFSRVSPPQIQQVLLNLVINARQAMPEGGHLRVRIGTDSTGQWSEIAVSDTGTGMEPAVLRRIFDPFFTTKAEADDAGLGGTGLGLPVCRDIVESHRGRLRVESRPGQGSTFTVRLPACPAPAASQGSQQGAA